MVISIPIQFGCGAAPKAWCGKKSGVFYAWYTWGNKEMNLYRGRKTVRKPLQIRE